MEKRRILMTYFNESDDDKTSYARLTDDMTQYDGLTDDEVVEVMIDILNGKEDDSDEDD